MGKRAGGQAKKLIDAAKHWSGWRENPFAIDQAQIDAMRAFGTSDAAIAAASARTGDHVFEVWPDNWPIFMTFLSLARQWRWIAGGMGPPIRLGLDYPAVESVFRLTGVKKKDRVATFAALQLMEDAVVQVESERAARK